MNQIVQNDEVNENFDKYIKYLKKSALSTEILDYLEINKKPGSIIGMERSWTNLCNLLAYQEKTDAKMSVTDLVCAVALHVGINMRFALTAIEGESSSDFKKRNSVFEESLLKKEDMKTLMEKMHQLKREGRLTVDGFETIAPTEHEMSNRLLKMRERILSYDEDAPNMKLGGVPKK